MFVDRLVGMTSHVVNNFRSKQRLTLFLTLVTVICLLTAAIFVVVIGSQMTTVQGRLYIDGQQAQGGINITLLFNESTLADNDGTNATGFYSIDVTGHEGEKALFSITLDGIPYIPTDSRGNRAIITFTQGIHEFTMDLFLSLQSTSENTDTDSVDSNEQDDTSESDDSSEDSSSEESGDSQDSDESDDSSGTNGDSGGSGGSGSSDDSEDDDETEDSNEDDSDSSSDSDNATDPENNEPLSSLTIDKYVWNPLEDCWHEDITIHVGETTQFHIILECEGEGTAHNVTVEDFLPWGIRYAGNAVVNEIPSEPKITEIDNGTMVQWSNMNLTGNESIVITYEVDLETKGNFVSIVTVLFNETEASMNHSQAEVKILGVESRYMMVNKTVRTPTSTFEHHVDVYVGEIVEFCITITNRAKEEFLYGITIIDHLPEGLDYQGKNVSLYYKENVTMINHSTNISNEVMWRDINAVIGAYLAPQEEISLRFFARVTLPLKMVNSVNVTATLGSNGRQIFSEDKALVNASLLYQNLSVDAGGSYEGYRYEPILLNATVHGGVPPYTYLWDLDNDSVYDDANGSGVSYIGTTIGLHYVHVKVIDAENANVTDTAFINISYQSLGVTLQTTFYGYVNESVCLTAVAYGGNPPYRYYWDLNNDTLYDDAYGSSIIHVWQSIGTFYGRVKVIDNASNVAIGKTSIVISLNNTAPSVPKIIDGVTEGRPETIYEYIAMSTDSDGDKLYYLWGWGDTTTSGWMGPYDTGIQITVGHYWKKIGVYTVRVKCRDEHGSESNWSKNMSVDINRLTLPLLLQNLLERLSERFPLLQQLFTALQQDPLGLRFRDLNI